ncbi:MAG: U32 family peptidase [Parachlamydiales bacterium]|nr:U32 family peptidase [Parachlamydiales bacterium]
MNPISSLPQITAPISNHTTLQAALDGGADSVYFGVDALNMRIGAAKHFSIDDIPSITSLCHNRQKKCYLALNSIIYNEDLPLMKRICDEAKKGQIDGLIASDFSVILYAHSLGIPVHLSTQMNITNSEEVAFFSNYADVMVLARELSLEQIQKICSDIQEKKITGPSGELIKIEVFIHGALCVAISGKCYMSLAQYNHSANRGQCLQACRRKYLVKEEETGKELIIDNQYIMSPKDLCTIAILDRLVHTGVSILKIEGRGKSPEYVKTVTQVYKEALMSILHKGFTPDKIETWQKKLKEVYNRAFWEGGYYLGLKSEEMWSGSYGSQATHKKSYAGKVLHYFPQKKIAECLIQGSVLQKGKLVIISGPKTGVVEELITSIQHHETIEPQQGSVVTFPCKNPVKKNDEIYLITPKANERNS